MQVGVINRRAQAKYAEFVSALDLVREALEEIDTLIGRVDPKRASGGWTVATPKELKGLRRAAMEQLNTLRASAQKYEAELISREWRL
ncbi:hypothetical protein [Amycolatopsis cihanbeyliensis]|uniref:WXG100 family type VII secretion target n=1 Tax=Amycolatopsis cihanbeyliensis TaxID=1128664 RepID=A0A542DQR5_AMYCI|nr:hypothetical protein [Amycolatopsis cihanbeyliensis]TQJ05451.1 hypothetical protein FB471_5282 [Amycolatopsis cihanbeyliensis]